MKLLHSQNPTKFDKINQKHQKLERRKYKLFFKKSKKKATTKAKLVVA